MATTAIKMFGSMVTKTGGKVATKFSPLVVVDVALSVVDAGISAFRFFSERGSTRQLEEALRRDREVIDQAVDEHWRRARASVNLAKKISLAKLEHYQKELNVQLNIFRNQVEERQAAFAAASEQRQTVEQMEKQTRAICCDVFKYVGWMVDQFKKAGASGEEIENLFTVYEKAMRNYGKTLNMD